MDETTTPTLDEHTGYAAHYERIRARMLSDNPLLVERGLRDIGTMCDRLAQYESVKVPEPTIWAMDWSDRKMRVVNKDEHLDEYVWHEDHKQVLDLLRRETVRADDADTDKLRAIGLYDSCKAELAAARQREGEIRAGVIEECARVCDKVGQRLSHGAGYACKIAAEEIRNSA